MMLKSPYVAFAFFCERVLQEQDGVLSAIRIVDRLIVQHAEKGIQPKVIPIQSITLLIGLKSGDYKGKGTIAIKGCAPSGKAMNPEKIEQAVDLKGGGNGCNVIVNAGLPFTEEGVYWFDIYFENRLLTRTPLSVSVFESENATSPNSPLKTDRPQLQ